MKALDSDAELDARVAGVLKDALATMERAPEGGEHMAEQAELEARVSELEQQLATTASERDEAATSVSELEAKVAQLEKAATPEPTDPVEKALADPEVPESVKAIMKSALDRAAEAEKSAAEASEVAKAERSARERAIHVEKAASLKALPIDPEKFGEVMHTLASANDEVYAEVSRVLTAANELVTKGAVLKAVGSDAPAEDSAEGKLNALAKSIAERDGISFAQGIAKALETPEGKALYAARKEGVS